MKIFPLARSRRVEREKAAYFLVLIDSFHGRIDESILHYARQDVRAGEAEIGFEDLFTGLYEADTRISHDQASRLIEVSRALRLPVERYAFLADLEAFPEDADNVATDPLPPTPEPIREAATRAT